MNLLLDTHSFLWFAENASELSSRAKTEIENISNRCFISIASLWELSIKSSLNKIELYRPFDRLILSQAISQDLVIVTKDGIFEKYTSNIIW